MDKEEILRQEAIRLLLQGQSVQVISVELGRSCQWVYKVPTLFIKMGNDCK